MLVAVFFICKVNILHLWFALHFFKFRYISKSKGFAAKYMPSVQTIGDCGSLLLTKAIRWGFRWSILFATDFACQQSANSSKHMPTDLESLELCDWGLMIYMDVPI